MIRANGFRYVNCNESRAEDGWSGRDHYEVERAAWINHEYGTGIDVHVDRGYLDDIGEDDKNVWSHPLA